MSLHVNMDLAVNLVVDHELQMVIGDDVFREVNTTNAADTHLTV